MTAEPSADLSRVSTTDLEALRELVARGRLRCPLSTIRLAGVGLERLGPSLRAVQGLGSDEVLARLDLVLAERRRHRRPTLDLVWTGPEATRSATRSTAVVVREMFERAERSVVVAGFSFDEPEILRPLHAAMRDRGVKARLFVNVASDDIRRVDDVERFVEGWFRRFFAELWPFGDPRPETFYDPRQTVEREFVSLHAKCVVVDEREVLVTSANFTGRGQRQTGNIELGVRIEDPTLATAVAGQWNGLVAGGILVPAPR